MQPIDLYAELKLNHVETVNYQLKEAAFSESCKTIPLLWEQKCVDEYNGLIQRLLSCEGFIDFFISNNCYVREEAIIRLLNQSESTLLSEKTIDFFSHYGWRLNWSSMIPGYLWVHNGFVYDRMVNPRVTVTVEGKEYVPFSNEKECL